MVRTCSCRTNHVSRLTGNLDTEDAHCQILAAKTPSLVISVDYPLTSPPGNHPLDEVIDSGLQAVNWVSLLTPDRHMAYRATIGERECGSLQCQPRPYLDRRRQCRRMSRHPSDQRAHHQRFAKDHSWSSPLLCILLANAIQRALCRRTQVDGRERHGRTFPEPRSAVRHVEYACPSPSFSLTFTTNAATRDGQGR